MKEQDEVISILQRIFKAGIIRRLPKRREDAEVLMALAMVGLDPESFYDEAEVNKHLSAWLDIIGSEGGVSDHVTLRRSLIDFGFLRRTSDGAVYRTMSERIVEVLSPAARSVDPKQVFAEVESARKERKMERV